MRVVRGRPFLLAPLTTSVLLLAAVSLPPARAFSSGPMLSAVLTLAQDAGDRVRLHQLAAHRGSRAALAALAPEASRRSAALRWAAREHLTVQRSDAWTVTVTGEALALATAFGASVRSSSRGTWAVAPVVPASLLGQVDSVVGLDSRPFQRRHATADGLDNPQTPATLRAAYDLPTTWKGANG